MNALFRFERTAPVVAQGCAVAAGVIALAVGICWLLGQGSLTAFGVDYIPMAPTSAWLMVLLNAALFSHSRWPQRRASRVFVMTAAGVTGAAGLLVSMHVCPSVQLVLETWLAGTTIVAGIPLGRMSPHSAGTFLCAAGALGCLQGFTSRPRLWQRTAFALAMAVVGSGSLTVLSYIAGMPLLSGSGNVPMALLTGIGFTVLGVGLMVAAHPEYLFFQELRESPSETMPEMSRRFRRGLTLAFLSLIASIGVLGFYYLRWQMATERSHVDHELSAIADLKAHQIAEWRLERIRDVRIAMENPFIAAPLQSFLRGTADATTQDRVMQWLQSFMRQHQATRGLLLDAQCQARLIFPADKTYFGPIAETLAREAIASNRALMSDLHRSQFSEEIHMDLITPIPAPAAASAAGATSIGAIVLEVNPKQYIYPLIQTWPTPSQTAETLLVRREGNDCLFLNELRHQTNTAFRLRVPLAQADSPAVQGILGNHRTMTGLDYRGVPVLATSRSIPGTPWVIVAEDQREVFAPIYRQAWNISSILGMLILGVMLGLNLLWKQHTTESLRRQVEVERERVALAERLGYVMKCANDIIILADEHGQILEANDRAFEHYGYTPDELKQKKTIELRPLANRNDFPQLEEQLRTESGALFETMHQRRDGSTFPVEISIRRVRIAGTGYRLIVGRDITERKHAQEDRERFLSNLQQKTRDLEDLIYAASHDLRAPLVNIQGFGARLEKACNDWMALTKQPIQNRDAASAIESRIRKSLNFIQAGTTKMNQLVNGLLHISRLGRVIPKLEPLDMNRLMVDVLAALAHQVQAAGATVKTEPLPFCKGDAHMINQVFTNLVDNAIKYRDPARPLQIRITGRPEGAQAVYCVEDTGIGIAPEHQQKIWGMFHRLYPEGPVSGEGLGLNIVRRILESHQGRTWAESVPGQGSKFYVSLPMDPTRNANGKPEGENPL